MGRLYLGFGAIAVIVLGAYLVATRLPLATSDSVGTWRGPSGLSIFSNPSETNTPRRPTTQEIVEGQASGQEFIFLPTGNTADGGVEEQGFDLEALLSQLTEGSSPNVSGSGSTELSSIYSFIPEGFISTTMRTEERSDEQQALFEYGNSVGSYLRGFEDSHASMLSTLKNANEDRGNAAKAEAAAQVGIDYIRLGEELEAMGSVPAQASMAHQAFALAHMNVGEKLIEIVYAEGDEQFLSAIETYNTTVEEYTKRYVALATLFQSYGVQFASHDPGSVFTFSSSLSL